jgi:PKD repeat protein
MNSAMKALLRSAAIAAFALTSACTVHGTDVPNLGGPSEFALSVAVSATPDVISQDGTSQSTVVVIARDAAGKGKAGLSVKLDTLVGGSLQDYGMLSARTAVTGSDGRAQVIYTAPPPPSTLGGGGTVVTILATPIGSDFQTSHTESAEVRLVPPGVVLPPASTPTAHFSVTPTPVNVGVAANFDASASCATQSPCSSSAGLTSFAWTFGDGSSATGPFVSHTYATSGDFVVRLTVTNDRGASGSTTQTVTVGTSAEPTAVIDVSGADSATTTTVVGLSAERSKVAPGRTLKQINWNLGTANVTNPSGGPVPGGQFPSGLRQSVIFTQPGEYTVILSVLDDAGQKGTATVKVTVH